MIKPFQMAWMTLYPATTALVIVLIILKNWSPSGIDPSVFASGKFTATRNRITKRGSRQLRYVLVMAVQCGLIRSRNNRLKDFYECKRAEGKSHKVALVACTNKLVHWLYAIIKSKKSFGGLFGMPTFHYTIRILFTLLEILTSY